MPVYVPNGFEYTCGIAFDITLSHAIAMATDGRIVWSQQPLGPSPKEILAWDLSTSTVTFQGIDNQNVSFRLPRFATGSLPAAGVSGRLAFNTTTGLLNFDNGSVWGAVTGGGGGGGVTSLEGLTGDLTFTDDTNVTMIGAGSTLTLGWTGTLGTVRGGTNLNTSASNGVPSINGGTWTINNVLTATRVLYAGASNTVTSAASLVFDAGATILTISGNAGTLPAAVGSTILRVSNLDTSPALVLVDTFGNVGQYVLRRANGTASSPTALTTNDSIGSFVGKGYATAYTDTRVGINFFAAETWTGSNQGTYMQLAVTPLGSTTFTEAVRILGNGNMGIGTPAPGQKLSVAGTIESTSGGFKFPDATTQATAGVTGSGTSTQVAVYTGSLTLASYSGFVWDNGSTALTITGTINTVAQNAVSVKPFGASAGNTGEVRFLELAANGVHYVGFKAPDILAGNVLWVLPTADGTNGFALITNGAGVLSWASIGGGGGSGITSLNGLTDLVQTFTNDTNITMVSAAATHTITWAGTLAALRGGTGLNTSASNGVPTINAGTWTINNVLTAGRILYSAAGNTIATESGLTWSAANTGQTITKTNLNTTPALKISATTTGSRTAVITVPASGSFVNGLWINSADSTTGANSVNSIPLVVTQIEDASFTGSAGAILGFLELNGGPTVGDANEHSALSGAIVINSTANNIGPSAAYLYIQREAPSTGSWFGTVATIALQNKVNDQNLDGIWITNDSYGNPGTSFRARDAIKIQYDLGVVGPGAGWTNALNFVTKDGLTTKLRIDGEGQTLINKTGSPPSSIPALKLAPTVSGSRDSSITYSTTGSFIGGLFIQSSDSTTGTASKNSIPLVVANVEETAHRGNGGAILAYLEIKDSAIDGSSTNEHSAVNAAVTINTAAAVNATAQYLNVDRKAAATATSNIISGQTLYIGNSFNAQNIHGSYIVADFIKAGDALRIIGQIYTGGASDGWTNVINVLDTPSSTVARFVVRPSGALGINTSTPVTLMDVVDTSTANVHGKSSLQYGSNQTGASMNLFHARGTAAAPGAGSALLSGDFLGSVGFFGSDGTTHWSTTAPLGAAISAVTTQGWTNSAHGTDLVIGTTPNGSTINLESFRVTQAGVARVRAATNFFVAASTVANTGTFSMAALSAARTWTFPNVSGNVVTTGDAGTVSNTMLASNFITIQGSNVALGGATLSTGSFPQFGAVGLGVVAQSTDVGSLLLKGAGAAVSTTWTPGAGTFGGGIFIQDSGGSAGNGGGIIFAAGNANPGFMGLKGELTNGSNNTAGDLVLFSRINTTDAHFSEVTRFYRTGGIGVQGATDQGAGTINVNTNLYKAGTAYNNPDYVLEHAYTGKIQQFAKCEGADRYNGLRPLAEVEAFVSKEYALPRVAEARQDHRYSPTGALGLADGGDAVLASLEEAYLYIFQLKHQLDALRDELRTK